VQSGGVVATAAAMLGISRQALYRRMDRLGVELERRPKV
jgi:DNA-binding NtrC family response regulator